MKLRRTMSKVVIMFLMIVFLWAPSITAYAEVQVTDLSKLMVTTKAIDALEEPQEQSKSVFSYEAEASVLVTGETTNGWYRVIYQDKVGFVKKADLKETDINIAALDEEFGTNEIEGKIFVETVERIRAQITRSRIWGTIIVVLIVGIFGTGIYSTIKSEQRKKQNEQVDEQVTEQRENEQENGSVEMPANEKKKEKIAEQEDEMIEPLSFKPSEVEPLDIIDLDEEES